MIGDERLLSAGTRGARLAEELVNGRGRRQFAADLTAIEQLLYEGMQAVRPDAATGFPEDCGRRPEVGSMDRVRPEYDRGPQQPDGVSDAGA